MDWQTSMNAVGSVFFPETLFGLRVVRNSMMFTKKQIKFGKSKKKRHRKKQAKKPENWADVPDQHVYRIGDMIVGHPTIIKQMLDEVKKQTSST